MTPGELYLAFRLDMIKSILLFLSIACAVLTYALINVMMSYPEQFKTVKRYRCMVFLILTAFAICSFSITGLVCIPSSAQYTAQKLVEHGIMDECSLRDATTVLKVIEQQSDKYLRKQ